MNSSIFSKKNIKNLIVIVIWLTAWELVSLFVNNSILIVGPFSVVKTILAKAATREFYVSIGTSFFKMSIGYFSGLVLGLILAVLSWKYSFCEVLLNPFMAFIKASPVASFVVLFLIWWSSGILSVAICICVVLPQIYVSVLQGLKSTDQQLIEAADLYKLHPMDRLHYVYRPMVCQHLEGAVKISAGMSWKAGIAAEVIGTPDHTIGNSLYMSKIYLDTSGVLAITCVIIILSIFCEKILLWLLRLYRNFNFKCHGVRTSSDTTNSLKELNLREVSVSFENNPVLNYYSGKFASGKQYYINWPSGGGKTTLFRIIAGLMDADSGQIVPKKYSVSMLFQENRLFEEASALKNVEIICGDEKKSVELLEKILPDIDLEKPVNMLSGGEKRRVAIARACAKKSEIMLFDEPFEGLDEDNRDNVKKFIIDNCEESAVLIASHIEV